MDNSPNDAPIPLNSGARDGLSTGEVVLDRRRITGADSKGVNDSYANSYRVLHKLSP